MPKILESEPEEWRDKEEFKVDEDGNVTRVPPDPDIGQLDICVARVLDVTRHRPYINTTYVATLDTGRYSRKRKAASALAQFYQPSQLLGRLVLTVLNVRPMIKRDLIKRFFLMCAQDPNNRRLELLDPPAGSVEGDSVVVEGFRREPLLQISLGNYERKSKRHYFLPYKPWNDSYHYEEYDDTKRKFDSTIAHLWVTEGRVVEFMGRPLQVEGKGVVSCKTLKDCPVVFE